ncbi:DCC1-like thiol-disulfide oxidoreductase family protein [Luteimonas suaedae]|uniref:DCC1-like thiol-disulfide oxidoreductase family protein n=1 Tax=Luteimonas suaedae TaxID=2605430 RepID=UPI0011F026DF|nr:DCC1-like thiol-disulfide oxidoreductase family protein [Luteimonas suaedae]
MISNHGKDQAWLVYDGECPVCTTWCRYARIRAAVGDLHLVDARQPGPLMEEITAAGLDIDQGMVLKFKDVLYYGPDAIWMMSLLSTPSGLFNRLNFWLFGNQRRARIFYPVGKAFRNVVLKVMGIEYIGNLPKVT